VFIYLLHLHLACALAINFSCVIFGQTNPMWHMVFRTRLMDTCRKVSITRVKRTKVDNNVNGA